MSVEDNKKANSKIDYSIYSESNYVDLSKALNDIKKYEEEFPSLSERMKRKEQMLQDLEIPKDNSRVKTSTAETIAIENYETHNHNNKPKINKDNKKRHHNSQRRSFLSRFIQFIVVMALWYFFFIYLLPIEVDDVLYLELIRIGSFIFFIRLATLDSPD